MVTPRGIDDDDEGGSTPRLAVSASGDAMVVWRRRHDDAEGRAIALWQQSFPGAYPERDQPRIVASVLR